MPYKNILWIKLEKRLLNAYRFYTMSEESQLFYVKLLLLSAQTNNKIPKKIDNLRTLFRTKLNENEIKECLNEIRSAFPKFVENKDWYSFREWKQRHNFITKESKKEFPRNSQGVAKEHVDKIREDKIREDKKGIIFHFFKLKGWDYEKDKKKIVYPRYIKPAKDLYELCNSDLSLAKKKLDNLCAWAKEKNLEWTLSTAIKRFNAEDKPSGEEDKNFWDKIKKKNKDMYGF